MESGIALLSIIPLREEPSHRSQQVSQLLFGETYQILQSERDWIRIRMDHDGYEGWIAENQYSPGFKINFSSTVTSVVFRIKLNNELIPVTMGALIPSENHANPELNISCIDTISPIIEDQLSALNHYSRLMVNVPYLWGGRSPFGIDCSGFTQLMYRMLGKSILRDAWQQASEGITVTFVNEARPGDLAFFDDEEGKITHVGLILDNQKIIHASGCVRIDHLDHEGIFNEQLKKYTHKLRLIRRYF